MARLPLVLLSIQSIPRAYVSAEKGHWWRRFGARLVDSVILYIPNWIIRKLVFAPMIAASTAAMASQAALGASIFGLVMKALLLQFPVILVGLALSAAYEIYFIGSRGQTLGKMVAAVKVVPVEGGEMTYGRAAIRWAAFNLIPLVLLLIPILGVIAAWVFYLWLSWDEKKQGIHDYIAQTYVIRI